MRRLHILALVLAIGGCDLGDRDNKLALSTLVGMGAGSVIGWYGVGGGFADKFIASSFLSAGAGVGAYFLADYLLPQDREKLDTTAYNALNNGAVGETIAWGDQSKGTWGTFTPTREYTDRDGHLCRDYVATLNVRGETGRIEEAACRLHDGAWRIVTI